MVQQALRSFTAYPYARAEEITRTQNVSRTTTALNTLSLEQLTAGCQQETLAYRHGQAYDDCYAVELFRRAMQERDSRAWAILQTYFTSIMLGWLHRHAQFDRAYELDSEENYIAQAFTRLWQASCNNPNLYFSTLASALDYLRASLNGVIMDTLRNYMRKKETTLPEPDSGNDLSVDWQDDAETSELWQAVTNILLDERERRVAYLLYHCGLKPRELVLFCPQEFASVSEVYRMRRNIIHRLTRHADLIKWKIG